MGWYRQLMGVVLVDFAFLGSGFCVYQPLRWMRKKKGVWRFTRKKKSRFNFNFRCCIPQENYIYIHTHNHTKLHKQSTTNSEEHDI